MIFQPQQQLLHLGKYFLGLRHRLHRLYDLIAQQLVDPLDILQLALVDAASIVDVDDLPAVAVFLLVEGGSH